MPLHENTPCPFCGARVRSRRRDRVAKTCGASPCRGALYRARSEAKYRLDALDAWTLEMAYALGLFFADGCLTKSAGGRGSWRVLLCNTDLPTVEWWHAFLGNPNKITHVAPEKVRGAKLDKWMSTATSDTLGERLFALGAVPRKSTEPIRVPLVPEEVLPHFLRGFCDGDGSVGIRRERKMKGGRCLAVTLTSNSAPFRADLRALLAARGMLASENRISLLLKGGGAERFCRLIYDEDGPGMTRKKAAWEEWQMFRVGHGGLISESDPHTTLRGLRPQPWHGLVGTMPDRDLAARFGMSKSNVALVRKKLVVLPVAYPERPPVHRSWHEIAGKMLDAEVARIGDVTFSAVAQYRKRMGIPRYGEAA